MTGKPDDISRMDPTRRIEGDQKEMEKGAGTPTRSFEQYMEKAARPTSAEAKTPTVSPFDLIHGQTTLASGASFDSLLGQVKSAHGMLGDVSNQLNTKNLKLKQSQRYLLRNKLGDANAHLRAAAVKLGAEVPSPPAPTAGGGILGKFLDLVSEGQSNAIAAQNQLAALKSKGENLNPGDFLMIQVKMAHAQQEIEYASIMLSKAVDDMKTMFNVQL